MHPIKFSTRFWHYFYPHFFSSLCITLSTQMLGCWRYVNGCCLLLVCWPTFTHPDLDKNMSFSRDWLDDAKLWKFVWFSNGNCNNILNIIFFGLCIICLTKWWISLVLDKLCLLIYITRFFFYWKTEEPENQPHNI